MSAAERPRVLFVHGQESGPQGTKARLLAQHFEAQTPQMDTSDFEACVRQIAAAIDAFRPDVVVGSSYGGAVAVALLQRGRWRGPTLLLAPAVVQLGLAPRLPEDVPVTIVHGTRDDVVPIAGSLALARSGSPEQVQLLEVRDDHRLSATTASGRLPALVRELARRAAGPAPASERHLRVFLEEPALWPVLLAGLGALGAVLAWLLATAQRSGHPAMLLGIAVLIVASGELVRRDLRGARPGLRGTLLLALWAVAIAVALVAGRYGVL